MQTGTSGKTDEHSNWTNMVITSTPTCKGHMERRKCWIIDGDFNSHVGLEQERQFKCLGPFGFGNANEQIT